MFTTIWIVLFLHPSCVQAKLLLTHVAQRGVRKHLLPARRWRGGKSSHEDWRGWPPALRRDEWRTDS